MAKNCQFYSLKYQEKCFAQQNHFKKEVPRNERQKLFFLSEKVVLLPL